MTRLVFSLLFFSFISIKAQLDSGTVRLPGAFNGQLVHYKTLKNRTEDMHKLDISANVRLGAGPIEWLSIAHFNKYFHLQGDFGYTVIGGDAIIFLKSKTKSIPFPVTMGSTSNRYSSISYKTNVTSFKTRYYGIHAGYKSKDYSGAELTSDFTAIIHELYLGYGYFTGKAIKMQYNYKSLKNGKDKQKTIKGSDYFALCADIILYPYQRLYSDPSDSYSYTYAQKKTQNLNKMGIRVYVKGRNTVWTTIPLNLSYIAAIEYNCFKTISVTAGISIGFSFF